MVYKESLMSKFDQDIRYCENILGILDNMNLKPTTMIKELIDEHLKKLRQRRKSWLDIFEREHPYNLQFIGDRNNAIN